MNYILKFVPFDNTTKFAGVGMAGNIMIIINELLGIEGNVYVDMSGYENICGPKSDSNNWNLYFDQIEKPIENTLIELRPPRPNRLNYYHNYLNTDDVIIASKEAFFKHFKLNDEIETKINNFYETHIKDIETLSCQIRLGDMVNNHNTASLDVYLIRIKNILNENPSIKQIFLATDDQNAIDYLEKYLEIPILYQKNIYRTSSNNPFERVVNERENHNHFLCKEVIIDIFLLGKCDYFLRADVSSVSIVATILSDKIKKMYFLR
jgi:hypothetical protein